MPGNTPNISRDSFDATKSYDKVTLQQGVPIPDSDWNELNDVLRMAMLVSLGSLLHDGSPGYTVGNGFNAAQIDPSGANNNFLIEAGWALVEGVLVPTTNDDPPEDMEYDSSDNYLIAGTVTAINGGAGTITDAQQLFQSFHDLLSTGNHGPCRVRMLTGAEAGNEFDVSAYTSTTLTLSGGIGSIAVDDTFIVKPPALTTPGGTDRTDTIYLMVWWEDIASEEDPNIEHPGLGVETSHRSKRRWCVRVTEDSTTVPTTPTFQAFSVRYLKLREMVRDAGTALIQTYPGETVIFTKFNEGVSFLSHMNNVNDPHNVTAQQIYNPAFYHISATNVQQQLAEIILDYQNGDGSLLGLNTDYGNGPLTDINGGGLGDLSSASLAVAFAKVDGVLINRRAFTAVLSDGTTSTGGDYDAVDAIDDLASFTYGGSFLLRRGKYDWNTIGTFNNQYSVVIGELRQWGADATTDVLSLELPSGITGNFAIGGRYEHLVLASKHPTYRYDCTDKLELLDVAVQPGSLLIQGEISWIGGNCKDELSGNSPTGSYGLELTGSGVRGVIEGINFEGPPSGGAAAATVYVHDLTQAAGDEQPIVFRNCRFIAPEGGRAVDVYNIYGPNKVIFEKCYFEGSDEGYALYVRGTIEGVTFRDCTFYNEYGWILHDESVGSPVLDHCEFLGGSSVPTSYAQGIVSRGGRFINKCYMAPGSGNVQTTVGGTVSLIELGGKAGAAGIGDVSVKGLRIVLDGLSRFTAIAFHGRGSYGYQHAVYEDVKVYAPSASTVDRSTNGYSGRAAILELLGNISFPSMRETGMWCRNIMLEQIQVPNIADTGAAVIVRSCIVEGLTINGDASPGTGSIGDGDGIVVLREGAKVRDLQYCAYHKLVTAGAFMVSLGDRCEIDGGTIHRFGDGATSAFFGCTTNADGPSIRNMYCPDIRDWNAGGGYPIINFLALNASHQQIHGNTFLFFGTGSTHATGLIIGGIQATITNNIIRISRNQALGVDCGARSGALVDGNSIDYLLGSVTPTIVASAGDSVIGDNVLLA